MALHGSSRFPMVLLLILSTMVSMVQGQTSGSICPLCATPADLPTSWNDVVPGDGRTCRQIYLFLGEMSSNDPRCQPMKDVAQGPCCNGSGGGGGSRPTNPPPYTGPVGNEPACPICGTMEYPGIPNAFIVARYVGEFTCDQLYGRGLNGMTPYFMCGPLQDFARPVCGCGEYNPRCRDDPNQCWGAPGYNKPAPSPVSQPVSRPVSQPVSMPVSRPTSNQSPTIFNRKEAPEGGKYSTKLANNRGGAASTLRGGRREEEVDMLQDAEEEIAEPQALDFDFRVIERDDEQLSHHA
mmetsp:Transcript_69813/g.202585  ORF Transcript_69813/g.202585 Transcript_69813/m.202585 type:complete len:295 (-) Transcript_69813:31-915(-)